MKRIVGFVFAAGALVLAGCEEATQPASVDAPVFASGASQVIPDHYIVVFTDQVADPAGAARGLARAHGLGLRHVYTAALKGFAAVIPPARLDAIRADPRIRYVTPDHVDEVHAQTLPTGINRIEADGNTSATATDPVDVDIAIIDVGIDLDHPDLNVVSAVSFAGGNGDDKNGHGTHVAGTAAALDNGIGVVGVAPGASLHGVKVCKPGGLCFRSDIIAGIDYVTANADIIEVANISIGGSGSDDGDCGLTNNDPEHEAICAAVDAGVVIVVSAGNSSKDSKDVVPASYDEVITVSALADFDGLAGGAGTPTCRTDEDDSFASFSNFGADVDLLAPGVCILSTWNDGGTNTISGTSMSAPHVTGTVALYIAKNGRATDRTGVLAIRDALIASGIAQTDACGLSTFDDPDGIAEPIVFANAVNVGGDGSCGAAAGGGGGANTAPTADDKTVVTDEDTPVTVTLTASDPEECELTFSIVDGPANGTLSAITDKGCTTGTPNADAADVTYTPNADFNGNDSFTYQANDGPANSNIATVSVTINPVNDAPVANDDAASTTKDTPVTIDVLANDSDVDGDALSVTGASDPPSGTATVNADNTITYTPDPGSTGTDAFTYDIADGKGGIATATVTVSEAATTTETLTITKATYSSRKVELKVEATSSLGGDTSLKARFFDGAWSTAKDMTYNAKKDKWSFAFGSADGLTIKPEKVEVSSPNTSVVRTDIGGK